jgi:hypothetical protein
VEGSDFVPYTPPILRAACPALAGGNFGRFLYFVNSFKAKATPIRRERRVKS